jgi:hypothetical protein
MRRFIDKLTNGIRPANRSRTAKRDERRAAPGGAVGASRTSIALPPAPFLTAAVAPGVDPVQAKYQALGGADGILGQPAACPRLDTSVLRRITAPPGVRP